MSIVINGMDMPKGNSTKNLLIYSDGRVFTGHKDDVNYSAEERKTGKWIPLISTSDRKRHEWCGYQCSICGERTLRLTQCNFCPDCGSYNGGEQDG